MPVNLIHLTLDKSDLVVAEARLLESGPLAKLVPCDEDNRVVAFLDYDNEYLPVFSLDNRDGLSDVNWKDDGNYVCLEHDKTRFCILCQSCGEMNADTACIRTLPECMCYPDSFISDVVVIENRIFPNINLKVIKGLIKRCKQKEKKANDRNK